MATNIFEAQNITKRYGDFYALENVSLSINSGDIYGLVGENGAGKTTLMKIIGNLIHPNSGSITLFGERENRRKKTLRKDIGFLIEAPGFYTDMSAYNNLEFYRRLFNISDFSVIERVLCLVGLQDTGNKKVADFSLGMQQRLAIAITLINDPKFLVLDEPINGLDPSGITEVRELLTTLAKEKEIAVLITSHFLSELQLLATRFGFIHKGRLLQEITSDQLIVSDVKYLCIETTNPKFSMQLLQDTLHINVIKKEDTKEISIPIEHITIEAIMSLLIHNNIEILNIKVTSPSLENYYMNLIRRNVK